MCLKAFPTLCSPSPTQQAHVGLAGVPPPAPVLWRGHQHGLRRPGAVQVGSAVGERDAVIGAVDDQRVVVITGVFELLENQTDACGGELTHVTPQRCTRVASLFMVFVVPWSSRLTVVYCAAKPVRMVERLGEQLLTEVKALLNTRLRRARESRCGVWTTELL
ncbi:hypothetical protein EYF80_022966 [Liparis tanakae]|uniref:Uncharacterized protein n=1 Tax=Liparis tanakae TaxID=230148 RepID=A0A4Z2HMB7_9TELE|nr:hypothetical protein EYF80_022966 [Liparis tanakae]